MITVACVRTGDRYGPEYVHRLRAMVERHLPLEHRFICLTDRPCDLPGVDTVLVTTLPGWWAKLALLDPAIRGAKRTLYFDLDTVIVGDLMPLAQWKGRFGVCANFTRASGHPDWPCRYGSCVMSFAPKWGLSQWEVFAEAKAEFMSEAPRGDQQVFERLVPNATLLQDVMPPGYFVGRREFTDQKPEGAAVMVFAGRHNPHNTPHEWLRREWEGGYETEGTAVY